MRDNSKMENKMVKATIINKSDVPLHGLQPGKSRQIDVRENGTPVDKHWRRRNQDSVIDGCVEIVMESKKKNTTNKKQEVKD